MFRLDGELWNSKGQGTAIPGKGAFVAKAADCGGSGGGVDAGRLNGLTNKVTVTAGSMLFRQTPRAPRRFSEKG